MDQSNHIQINLGREDSVGATLTLESDLPVACLGSQLW